MGWCKSVYQTDEFITLKLKELKPSLTAAPSRLAFAEGGERQVEKRRRVFAPWRKWYSLLAWKELRERRFIEDHYACQMCGRVTAKPICDHIEPHRGNKRMFFDFSNTQTLCKPCHDGEKQRQENAGPR